jgi:hypothetical protein
MLSIICISYEVLLYTCFSLLVHSMITKVSSIQSLVLYYVKYPDGPGLLSLYYDRGQKSSCIHRPSQNWTLLLISGEHELLSSSF